MIDARYTEARKTDQSGGRGWDLFPEAPRKSHAIHFLIPLGGFLVVVGLAFWAASKVSG